MFCKIKSIVFKIKILTCLLLCRSFENKLNLKLKFEDYINCLEVNRFEKKKYLENNKIDADSL